jgi:hypothetical protein
MALKELVKPAKTAQNNKPEKAERIEEVVQKFISQGGTIACEVPSSKNAVNIDDHRLTLRIPQWLMDKVDEKRKERVGSISRNLWILELIEKACKK